MRVLQISESLSVEYGGTATACAELANHLSACGVDVSIVTLGGSNGGGPTWPTAPAVAASVCSPTGPRRLGYCRDMSTILSTLAPLSVIHEHGLWRLHYLQTARFALARRIPLIVSVHGMLLGHALRQRAAFKRVGRWLFQDAILQRAQCLHATAPAEAEAIRRLGFRGPIAIVPWGVNAPAARTAPSPAPPGSDAERRRRIVYLGRLHPSKGLDALLRAWAQVRERFPTWHLVMAGYDEGGYRARLEGLTVELGIAKAVTFGGPVQDSAREQLFADASLVILPSPAENFGFVVPEALARRVPVIATHGAPWSSLAAEACGWWIAPGESSLAAALAEALNRPPNALYDMGERGRRLVLARYTWDRIATSMVALYEWMLGRGVEPAFVQR